MVRLPSETLVYDLRRARAFCLEDRLAWLWRWSDGQTTVAALVRRARRRLGEGAENIDAALVVGALERLRRARLIEPRDVASRLSSEERREFIRRAAALGGFALLEVAAPRAADAATCVTSGACFNRFGVVPCGGTPCCTGGHCLGPGRCHCR